jgi:hypothetical protein
MFLYSEIENLLSLYGSALASDLSITIPPSLCLQGLSFGLSPSQPFFLANSQTLLILSRSAFLVPGERSFASRYLSTIPGVSSSITNFPKSLS